MTGKSDVEHLWDNQDDYNRLKSDDRDALKFNMFPQRVFRDANQKTMDRGKIAPGAIIDAQTGPSSDHQVDAKILEAQFSYNERIENALNRDKNDMYSLPVLDFTVSIDHRYPIADDEDSERTLDLQEVSQQARSRKSYLEKWQPDADGNAELAQIAAEQKMLDDGFDAAIGAETEAAAQNAL